MSVLDARRHIVQVVLDGAAASPEAERARADLEVENDFALSDQPGPYVLRLLLADGRLILDVRDARNAKLAAFGLALGTLRRLIKDYGLLLDSYALAVAEGREARIQAIDMGRRGLHDEGAELLMARLRGRVAIDHATARRLFTLVCALHYRL